MMFKERKDVLDRTMINLKYIENAEEEGEKVFEVTQLVNSFLMTLIQNWDDLESEWSQLKQNGITWPSIKTSEGDNQVKNHMGKIRDALTHGLFVFEEDGNYQICALHMWTCPDSKTVDWHAKITVEAMRGIIDCFCDLASRHNLDTRVPLCKGDSC